MYVFVFVYICMCMFVCVCVYVCVYICISVCMYVYICVYIYVYLCVCMYIYVCVYIYIYIKIWIPQLKNCFRQKYISYSGQIFNKITLLEHVIWRHMQQCKTSDDILLYLLLRFSFFWQLHFNFKHLTLNICYTLWPELIAYEHAIWRYLQRWEKLSNDILLYLFEFFFFKWYLDWSTLLPIFHCLKFRAKCGCLFMWLI